MVLFLHDPVTSQWCRPMRALYLRNARSTVPSRQSQLSDALKIAANGGVTAVSRLSDNADVSVAEESNILHPSLCQADRNPLIAKGVGGRSGDVTLRLNSAVTSAHEQRDAGVSRPEVSLYLCIHE